MSRPIPQYATIKHGIPSDGGRDTSEKCRRLSLNGTEVFMDDVVSRDDILFGNEEDLEKLASSLEGAMVKRIHCSYWAWPTALLSPSRHETLIRDFGGDDLVKSYYGDETGEHLFKRWSQEYELARRLGAQSFTFHLIDYAPIDGRWKFKIPRQEIALAMRGMIQRLLDELGQADLLTNDSPRIEIENAGFGLEYGMQTSDDAALILTELRDPLEKIRIGWDLNHLLHALGEDTETGRARFFLPDDEITPGMRELEKSYGSSSRSLGIAWLRSNIMDSRTLSKVGSIHLSDCAPKTIQYFTRGQLCEPFLSELLAQPDWKAMEEYGVGIVLDKYDSHVPVGKGMLSPKDISDFIRELDGCVSDFVVLHELKNEADPFAAIMTQKKVIGL